MKRNLLTLIALTFSMTLFATSVFSQARPTQQADGLTGTFRLDRTRSEDVAEIISSLGRISVLQRRNLESALVPPESLSIQTSGDELTIAWDGSMTQRLSMNGQPVTIDGMRVRASKRGNIVTLVETSGDAELIITMTPAGGSTLRISRNISMQNGEMTLFANSSYQKIDSLASFDMGESDDRRVGGMTRPTSNRPTSNTFVVPNGTYLTGILENDIVTGVSQDNDRFRLTVRAPQEFRGAVIDGYITGVSRSGRVAGRPEVTFNFDSITLANGREYSFAGILISVTDQEGKTVKIDTEGAAKGDSQGNQTAKRGGIGAGLGAVIGGIIGGGKGAAIGAVIGGGAGAGSVIVEGREDLKLLKGSSISVQASAPRN